jgi:DNA-binding Lrp family transcriptional regulator
MDEQGLSREAIEQRVQRLQEDGVVDLDAPLREAIPALARNMVRYRAAASWWIVASGENPHAVCECQF